MPISKLTCGSRSVGYFSGEGYPTHAREGLSLNKMNILDVFRKKEHVMYGELGEKRLARPVFNEKTNSMELEMKGEKYPLRGFPRHAFLHGPLTPLKRYIKNFIIEAMVKCIPFKIPDENLCEPVRELARVFDLMIEAEDEPDMKKLVGQLKDAVTMILGEDDAWKFRCQWFLEKLNMNKVKLNKSDKYYFRGKSFKVD